LVAPGRDDLSPEDFKHMRVGHIPLGRFCDEVVALATDQITTHGVLPRRWSWCSRDLFIDKYSCLGRSLWAKTASYHLLMIDGLHVFRIWTDVSKSCIVDINESLATLLSSEYNVTDAPPSCYRKTKPMLKRFKVESLEDAQSLCIVVKNLYRV
jgi:hypothetical protein